MLQKYTWWDALAVALAVVLAGLLLSSTCRGAGITQKELDALPKPDPHLFDKPPANFFGRGKPAIPSVTSERQRALLMAKAIRRRQRGRTLDARPVVDVDVEFAKAWTRGHFQQYGR